VLKEVDSQPEAAPLGERIDMVFKGTSVVRGRGAAVVTATGMATEMGNVPRLLGRTEQPKTPLQGDIEGIGRTLTVAVILIAVT
jgi:magnesium-transporting ATPase (P-type)